MKTRIWAVVMGLCLAGGAGATSSTTVTSAGQDVGLARVPAGLEGVAHSGGAVAVFLRDDDVTVFPERRSVVVKRFGANCSAVGAEIEVDADETIVNRSPEVLVCPDGSFVVVWVGSNPHLGGVEKVYYRRYTKAGVPDGEGGPTAVHVHPDVNGVESDPSLCKSADGGFSVCYSVVPDGETEARVFLMKFNSAGVVLTTQAQEVTLNRSSGLARPDLSCRADGTAACAYGFESSDFLTQQLRVSILDASGGVVRDFPVFDAGGAPTLLAGGRCHYGADGTIGVFFERLDLSVGFDRGVWGCIFDDLGNQLLAPVLLSGGVGGDGGGSPVLLPMANGNFACGWSEGGDVLFGEFDGSFGVVQAPVALTASDGIDVFFGRSDAVFLSDGVLLVGFQREEFSAELINTSVEIVGFPTIRDTGPPPEGPVARDDVHRVSEEDDLLIPVHVLANDTGDGLEVIEVHTVAGSEEASAAPTPGRTAVDVSLPEGFAGGEVFRFVYVVRDDAGDTSQAELRVEVNRKPVATPGIHFDRFVGDPATVVGVSLLATDGDGDGLYLTGGSGTFFSSCPGVVIPDLGVLGDATDDVEIHLDCSGGTPGLLFSGAVTISDGVDSVEVPLGLRVIEEGSFWEWAMAAFGTTGSPESQPGADPLGLGIDNRIRWACGLQADGSGRENLPRLELTGPTDVAVIFRVRANAGGLSTELVVQDPANPARFVNLTRDVDYVESLTIGVGGTVNDPLNEVRWRVLSPASPGLFRLMLLDEDD